MNLLKAVCRSVEVTMFQCHSCLLESFFYSQVMPDYIMVRLLESSQLSQVL